MREWTLPNNSKRTFKNPHMPNLVQFGQAVHEIKTTSGLTGNDVTVHRKWHHHVEKHPQKPPYAKLYSIWSSGSRDKNYFRFNRKWRYRIPEVAPPCWNAPSKTPIYQISSNSAKRVKRNYFQFNRKWRYRSPEVTSPCWKAPSKTPYAKFYSIRSSGLRDKNYFRFNRKWRYRTPKVTSPCWKRSSKAPICQILFNSAKRFTR